MQLNIAHLYPRLLNIYGDRGNITCLINRCLWRGIKVTVTPISLGDRLAQKQYDLYFGGGGQDRQQLLVAKDLQTKKKVILQEANREVPMLTICGTYQLFGHFFKTAENIEIPGISIFDAYTIASPVRKIGNIVIKINPFLTSHFSLLTSELTGFENHSGNTFIENCKLKIVNSTRPLGRVVKGFGNNGQDKTEGAVYKNVFGCYLHGPLLPKNPHFADLLIKLALELKYQQPIILKPLNDTLEWQAHQKALHL